jgi:hypothetical protein
MDLREREETEVVIRRFRMDAVHGVSPSVACKRVPTKRAVQRAAGRGG